MRLRWITIQTSAYCCQCEWVSTRNGGMNHAAVMQAARNHNRSTCHAVTVEKGCSAQFPGGDTEAGR
mgnify:CR=1 FL=1